MVVLVILGIVAVVILFQLYNVLGRKAGFRVEDKALGVKPDDFDTTTKLLDRPGDVTRMPNLEVLKTRDINFNEINFLEKARETYEQVVLAFHKGELDVIKDRLSERVFSTFRSAVSARTGPRTETLAFVDPPKADIDMVDFTDDTAQVRVRFLSELAYESPAAVEEPVPVTDGPKEELSDAAPPPAKKAEPKSNKVYKRTAEFWTFQKGLRSQNSAWLLTRVEAAKA
ncbi:MAG: Tim44/TimA family putative adaptor protein [Asticcacaulis sp.]